MDRTAGDSVRFWQWRTLIRVAINNQIDHNTLRSLLARAFDELEQEPDLMVWSGWESVIIYFGFADLVPLVSAPTPRSACLKERWPTSTESGPMPALAPNVRSRAIRWSSIVVSRTRSSERSKRR